MDPKTPSIIMAEGEVPRILPPTTVLATGEGLEVVPNDSCWPSQQFGVPVQIVLGLNGLQLTSNIHALVR